MLLTVTISTPKYLCVQDRCLVIKEPLRKGYRL